MKVCFICSEYPPGKYGGIGILVQTLTRSLARRGHEVRVIGIYASDYPAPDFEEDEGVKVWRMREPRLRYFGWLLGRWRLFRVIVQWAKDGEIDLVDVPDYQGWAAGWTSLPVPVIVRFSGSASHNAKELGRSLQRLIFWIENWSMRRADFYCSESLYLAAKTNDLFDLGDKYMQVIYNPVEPRPYSPPLKRVAGKVVFTGTLNRNKGVIQLLTAWPKVKEACPTAELHIFGKDWRMEDGRSMREYLNSEFQHAIKQGVIFHGFVERDAVWDALETATVAVYPSLVEGFAIAPLEAMSVGCPVIFTDRASGPELITHGKDGFLIAPQNTEAIADAIIYILRDEQVASQLGRAGWDKIKENFSTEIVMSQNEKLFMGCVERFQSKRK
ncbi:MAG: glycosyltransferase family 4 protein [Anaerolineales bacterium]|nr:glycosyltransferase family 4 protein [Anaerolineales bacterium]